MSYVITFILFFFFHRITWFYSDILYCESSVKKTQPCREARTVTVQWVCETPFSRKCTLYSHSRHSTGALFSHCFHSMCSDVKKHDHKAYKLYSNSCKLLFFLNILRKNSSNNPHFSNKTKFTHTTCKIQVFYLWKSVLLYFLFESLKVTLIISKMSNNYEF